MSFFGTLFGSRARADAPRDARSKTAKQRHKMTPIAQLDVDVYEADDHIIVYAQAAGARMEDISISIEGNEDIVIIEGTRTRPDAAVTSDKKSAGGFFTAECVWGDFYRRIILPDSVDVDRADAKIKNGVLIVILPLMHS